MCEQDEPLSKFRSQDLHQSHKLQIPTTSPIETPLRLSASTSTIDHAEDLSHLVKLCKQPHPRRPQAQMTDQNTSRQFILPLGSDQRDIMDNIDAVNKALKRLWLKP